MFILVKYNILPDCSPVYRKQTSSVLYFSIHYIELPLNCTGAAIESDYTYFKCDCQWEIIIGLYSNPSFWIQRISSLT